MFNDTAEAWAWQTDRIVTVNISIGGDRMGAMLDMPEARALLNSLTEAIAEIDARGSLQTADEALESLRLRLCGK